MNKEKFLVMLGFAKKANYLVAGESNLKDSIFKKNNIKLLILADDLSIKRKEYWIKTAISLTIPYCIGLGKNDMSMAIGMSTRSIIGIKNEQMAKKIESLLSE